MDPTESISQRAAPATPNRRPLGRFASPRAAKEGRISARAAAAAIAILAAAATVDSGICDRGPVLTALATDTRNQRSLFSLTVGEEPTDRWLVVLDARRETALLYPDPLAGLRTSASHGPGPFLSAGRCGDDCFQPLQWSAGGWEPLGYPIEHDPRATLHFTYDASGAPWLVFHRLTQTKGVLDAEAYRWNGLRWIDRGALAIQAVGSPAAGPDPRSAKAIISGTGRFAEDSDPTYWLPALPVLADSPGGQIVPLAGKAAIYLTFDSRVLVTLEGVAWRLERWTPWPNPLGRADVWQPGTDYSVDRPAGGGTEALPLLWYDDRQRGNPRIHLSRWRPAEGWQQGPSAAATTSSGGAIEHVLQTADGTWMLVGPCRSSGPTSWLEGWVARPGAGEVAPLRIALDTGWQN